MYDEFEKRDTVVIAVAQEDKDLKTHGQILANFKPTPRFDVVADLRHGSLKYYDRTTAYFIDKQGVVRQVFPMIIHARPGWKAILNEIDRITAAP